MGFGSRLPGTKLTLLSRSRATSGAPNRQCLFFGDLHCFMVCVFLPEGWSILTSALLPSYVLNVTGTRWDTIVEDTGESELYESVERTSYIFLGGIAAAEEAWSLANSRAKSKFFGNSAASSVSWACASSVLFSRRLASASKIFANGLR